MAGATIQSIMSSPDGGINIAAKVPKASAEVRAFYQEQMKAKGFSDADVARIHGPIGLNIGAVGAHEIAISIMAEMTKSLRLG